MNNIFILVCSILICIGNIVTLFSTSWFYYSVESTYAKQQSIHLGIRTSGLWKSCMVFEGNKYCENQPYFFKFLPTRFFSVLTALTSIVSTLKMCVFVTPWNRDRNLTMPTPSLGLMVFFGILQITSFLFLNESQEWIGSGPIYKAVSAEYSWAYYVAVCTTLFASVLLIITLRTERQQIRNQYAGPAKKRNLQGFTFLEDDNKFSLVVWTFIVSSGYLFSCASDRWISDQISLGGKKTEIGLWSMCTTSYHSANITTPLLVFVPKTRVCQPFESNDNHFNAKFSAIKVISLLTLVTVLASAITMCFVAASVFNFTLKTPTRLLGLTTLLACLHIGLFAFVPFTQSGEVDLSFTVMFFLTIGCTLLVLRFHHLSFVTKRREAVQSQRLLRRSQFDDDFIDDIDVSG